MEETATGEVLVVVVVPFPIWPLPPKPQQNTRPADGPPEARAHEWLCPSATCESPVRVPVPPTPTTETAPEELDVELFPKRPLYPNPQHAAVIENVFTAQVCVEPTLNDPTFDTVACTGEVRGDVVVLSPSWPRLFKPQHHSVPSVRDAHVEREFVATAVASLVVNTAAAEKRSVTSAVVPTPS
jgi:hypothetical protein